MFPCLLVFLISQSTTSRKRNPDIQQPCLTPVLISNQSYAPARQISRYSTFTPTVHYFHHLLRNAVAPHNEMRIKCFLQVDKAYIKVCVPFNILFKDIAQYKCLFRCTTALPEACCSWRSLLSILSRIRVIMILPRTFAASTMSVMPLWLLHSVRSHFHYQSTLPIFRYWFLLPHIMQEVI